MLTMQSKTNMQKLILFCWLVFSAIIIHAQTNCVALHRGVYYFYPKNSNYHYTEYFDDNLQHEVNNTTGDTALWSVHWNSDCEYECKYIAGSIKTDDKMTSFLKKHTLVYVIETVTPDYYLFKGYIDNKKNHQPIQIDTMWMNEKTGLTSNTLFEYVPDTSVITKQHFTDTSQFALMYIYRPGKLALSLATNLLYFDDNGLCVSRNNTGYVFKILKEGKYTLRTSIMKDSVQLPVDIRFGNRYYIKSDIHWGIHSRLYNFKLELSSVDAATGSKEFREVKIRS